MKSVVLFYIEYIYLYIEKQKSENCFQILDNTLKDKWIQKLDKALRITNDHSFNKQASIYFISTFLADLSFMYQA